MRRSQSTEATSAFLRYLQLHGANASGAFDVTALEPQHPYAPMDVYALGLKSGELGAATLLVTPELVMSRAIGAPGGTVTATA